MYLGFLVGYECNEDFRATPLRRCQGYAPFDFVYILFYEDVRATPLLISFIFLCYEDVRATPLLFSFIFYATKMTGLRPFILFFLTCQN
jgi:hypothetical protein